MTNEIEKQFFDAFGIKPKYTYLVTDIFYIDNAHTYTVTKDDLIDYFESKNCGRYKVIEVYKTHPYITDRILLELICIINQIDLYFYGEYDYFTAFSYKGLKEEVISKCKRLVDKNAFSEITGEHIKNRVRALFEEDTNNDR